MGRFLQPDPLVPEPFNPQSLNRYSYVLNDPVNRVDPTGMEPELRTNPDGSVVLIDLILEIEKTPGPAVNPNLFGDTVGRIITSLPGAPESTFGSFDAAQTAIASQSQSGFGLGDAALVGGAVAGGFIPGVGEALDAVVLADPSSTAFDRTLAGVSLAANFFIPVLPNFGAGVRAARAAGLAGEQAAGIVRNTTRIDSLTGTANFRVPDALSRTTLTEVKNVRSLSLTGQIRDFSAFARQEGLTFELFVRSDTRLSGPLQRAVDAGDVILMRTLP